MHGPQQSRQGFVVETNNDTGDWQIRWVRLVFAPVTMNTKKGSNVSLFGKQLQPCSASYIVTIFKALKETMWLLKSFTFVNFFLQYLPLIFRSTFKKLVSWRAASPH